MIQKNFDITVDAGGTYLLVRLFGPRDEARSRECFEQFMKVYARPLRTVLWDLRDADYPDRLYDHLVRFSTLASLCPLGRAALFVRDACDPAAILAGQAIRGAGHEVLVTEDREEAERFLAENSAAGAPAPCLRPLLAST